LREQRKALGLNVTNRRCLIKQEFLAIRERDEIQRVFKQGEQIWWDVDQTSDPVLFTLDTDPWLAPRDQFLRSVEVPA